MYSFLLRNYKNVIIKKIFQYFSKNIYILNICKTSTVAKFFIHQTNFCWFISYYIILSKLMLQRPGHHHLTLKLHIQDLHVFPICCMFINTEKKYIVHYLNLHKNISVIRIKVMINWKESGKCQFKSSLLIRLVMFQTQHIASRVFRVETS